MCVDEKIEMAKEMTSLMTMFVAKLRGDHGDEGR